MLRLTSKPASAVGLHGACWVDRRWVRRCWKDWYPAAVLTMRLDVAKVPAGAKGLEEARIAAARPSRMEVQSCVSLLIPDPVKLTAKISPLPRPISIKMHLTQSLRSGQ